jgi:imidazole glycerol phosphate synthase glutamine amidotransferase subunit
VIVVVDYGVNNLRSVVRALAAGGHSAKLSADPEVVLRADRVVVPGVGNFGQARRNLDTSGLGEAIRAVAAASRPLLGICLGMQLFFETSEEGPEHPGLGLLRGAVRRFRTDLPIPHVGWTEVTLTSEGAAHPALSRLNAGGPVFFYHVHSYHPVPAAPEMVLATADYGGTFPTVVGSANIMGAQFHPEKSQHAGIDFLSRFVGWRP